MKTTKKPSLRPQKIDANCWYYESRKSIDVVTIGDNGLPSIHYITWRKIKASLARCQPTKPKKGRVK